MSAPLLLQLCRQAHEPASSFLDFSAGRWSRINRPGRAPATLARIEAGRQSQGERFLAPFYGSGSGLTGRSLSRPIGTITTRDRWALIDGDRMRMLTADEALRAMSFPESTRRPENHSLTMHMAGNAVPPLAGARIIDAVRAAA